MADHHSRGVVAKRIAAWTALFTAATAVSFLLVRSKRGRSAQTLARSSSGGVRIDGRELTNNLAAKTSIKELDLDRESPTATGSDSESHAFIGNLRTLVYHPASSIHLPHEENRQYFASEDEAAAAGFRKAASA